MNFEQNNCLSYQLSDDIYTLLAFHFLIDDSFRTPFIHYFTKPSYESKKYILFNKNSLPVISSWDGWTFFITPLHSITTEINSLFIKYKMGKVYWSIEKELQNFMTYCLSSEEFQLASYCLSITKLSSSLL